MESKILEKILNAENEKLKEILDAVRNNPIFNDVMSKVKGQYFIKDTIHGISHNERVVIIACYIGIKEGLSNDELKILLEAALYHDIGRGFDGNHGLASSEIIERNKSFLFPELNETDIKIIEALCNGHSVDDKRYLEIAEQYKIEDISKFKQLLDILKDADALDRVRLPVYGRLDTSFLRTVTAQNSVHIAEELYKEYISIQRVNSDVQTKNKFPKIDVILGSKKQQLLYDGQNYYLLRSLNKYDIESLDNKEEAIKPRGSTQEEYTVYDVISQVRMFRENTGLISMSEDANVVLTYDRSNLHRFAMVRIPKEEIGDYKKVFPAGDYLLNLMGTQIDVISENAPEHVKEILSKIDRAGSIQEIIQTINGAERKVSTSLIEKDQQYLTQEEQLEQGKKIAKCKVLYYYGLIREVVPGKNISEYTSVMRMGYSSAEWLHAGKISTEIIVEIPKILVEALALVKQAEFQGVDRQKLDIIEQKILSIVNSGKEIPQEDYLIQYTSHNDIRQDLSIDKAFELTSGEISYRDTNIQIMAIRSLAEMTLNKRAILNLLTRELPEIDVKELLRSTYCINPELITRVNNKGNQLGKNVNLLISDYGYNLDNELSTSILSNVENLPEEQLKDIVQNGVNSQIVKEILTRTRENSPRIQLYKSETLSSRYIAEAIVEGYNWKKSGNSLIKKEREMLANILLSNVTRENQLYKLYKAISKLQVEGNKFSQNEIFAIIINLAIDGKIGNISWKELINKDIKEIRGILLNNKNQLQGVVLPISIDLLESRGKSVDSLEQELIELGIDKNFLEGKKVSNKYIAKQIVERYDFGRELTQEEKRAIIISILDNKLLDQENGYYLTTVIQNMEKIGLTQQEIYGMIINFGINGSILEEKGYDYSRLLANKKDSCQTIAKHKHAIQAKVTEGTIDRAVSSNLEEKEQEELTQELIKLGIDEKFLEEKHIRNIYIAKQIVERYDFGRELSQEEKRAIIISILKSSLLSRRKPIYYLTTLIQNMEKIGLTQQEIYGMIINLGINKRVLEEKGYSYTYLLSNANDSCQTIAKYKDEIQTRVSEETIQKAIKKAKKRIKGEEIARATGELLIVGQGGSEICDAVQAYYQSLIEPNKEKKGSGRDLSA